MKYLIVLIFCVMSISSAWSMDMVALIDEVASRFEIKAEPVPEFASNVERDQSYGRSIQIAAAYMEKGNPKDALRKYIYAFRTNPNSPVAIFMIGTVLIDLKGYDQAVAIFEELERHDPSSPVVNNNLGWIYATAEDPAYRDGRKAEQYALRALFASQNGATYHVWSTVAEARFVYGNYEGALQAAKQAFALARANLANEKDLQTYKDTLDKCERAWAAEKALSEGAGIKK
jgi:tetratricopeptide (TPR) repeat protein